MIEFAQPHETAKRARHDYHSFHICVMQEDQVVTLKRFFCNKTIFLRGLQYTGDRRYRNITLVYTVLTISLVGLTTSKSDVPKAITKTIQYISMCRGRSNSFQ